MKIAVWLFRNISTPFGTAVRARSLAEILKEKHEVAIIGDIGPLERIRYVRGIYRLPKLMLTILKNRFDIILFENDFRGFTFFYPILRLRGAKLIFDVVAFFSEVEDEWNPPRWRVKLNKFLEEFVMRHADYVTAISPGHFDFYKGYTSNISVIPHFIDEAVFIRDGEHRHHHQRDYKLVGVIGSFARPENWVSLEFVYHNLHRFDPKIKFVVIGSCERRIESDRIIYTGYLPDEDYVNQLYSLDAVLDYKEPTKGPYTKVIESMACGLPVFIAPRGMIGFEQATLGEDILVYPKEELVDKVNELIFDDNLMRQIGRKARLTAEKHFTQAACRQRLLDIVDRFSGGK